MADSQLTNARILAPNSPQRWIVLTELIRQQNTFTGRLTEDMLDAVFLAASRLADDPGS